MMQNQTVGGGVTPDPNSMPPYVTFEKRPVIDRTKELSQGVYGFRDVNMAFITRPGQRDTVEKEAEVWLAELATRAKDGFIPAQWPPHFQALYEAWKKGEEAPVNGTPITGWALLSPAEQKTILAVGIRSIEDLSTLSDEAVRAVGMGASVWKQKAIDWLRAAKDTGPLVAELATLKRDNATLKEQNEAILKEIQALKAKLPK